jgi:hypothetical protein
MLNPSCYIFFILSVKPAMVSILICLRLVIEKEISHIWDFILVLHSTVNAVYFSF